MANALQPTPADCEVGEYVIDTSLLHGDEIPEGNVQVHFHPPGTPTTTWVFRRSTEVVEGEETQVWVRES